METRQIIQNRNEELRAQLANPLDEKQRKVREQELARFDQMLSQATAARDKLDALVNPVKEETTPESVDALIAEINNPTPDTDTKKSEAKLISMAMASPQLMTAEKIQELVNNSDFNISESTRKVLRVLSEAQVKTNALKGTSGVRKDIIEGGKGFMGMNQYRAQVAKALETGNTKAAKRLLNQLSNFVDSSANKAAVATQAWDNGNGRGTQTLAHGGGMWTINQGDKVDKDTRAKSGSLELNSAGLVQAIEAEAQIVAATHAALAEAFRLTATTTQTNQASSQQATPATAAAGTEEQQTKISQEAKQGANNVQNVPPQEQRQKPQPEAKAVQGTGKAGKSGNQGSTDARVSEQTGRTESDTNAAITSIPPWEDLPTDIEKDTETSVPPWEDLPDTKSEKTTAEAQEDQKEVSTPPWEEVTTASTKEQNAPEDKSKSTQQDM